MSHTLRRTRLIHVSTLALAATLFAACSGGDSATEDSVAAADSAALTTNTPAASAAAPNDAQIAHIAVTANAIDSAKGMMAREKGAAKDVKDYGQMMATDHGAVNRQAVALVTKLNVTPEDNETSRSLKSAADSTSTTLQGLTGAAFDRAYIDNEVAFHQTVLDALDQTLIPNAQNAELKALLEKVRPNIAAHLERAKSIQGSLAK